MTEKQYAPTKTEKKVSQKVETPKKVEQPKPVSQQKKIGEVKKEELSTDKKITEPTGEIKEKTCSDKIRNKKNRGCCEREEPSDFDEILCCDLQIYQE
jgi:predicted HTH transcriptional regulator